jgi:hypothetical protein
MLTITFSYVMMARLPENNAFRKGTKEFSLLQLKFGNKENGKGDILKKFMHTRKGFIV